MSTVVQMKARFRLVNVGRDKVTREVECGRWNDLLREVGKHLRSSDIDVSDAGTVLVGGFRPVGRIEPLDALAREWLPLFDADTNARSAP
jgi:hypothetical protein